MFRKIRILSLLAMCICGFRLPAQPYLTVKQTALPFLRNEIQLFSDTLIFNQLEPSSQKNYLLTGTPPTGTIIRRQFAEGIYIVSFPSENLKSQAEKSGLLLRRVNDRWKLSPGLLKTLFTDSIARESNLVTLFLTVDNIALFEKKYTTGPDLEILARYPETGAVQVKTTVKQLLSGLLPDPSVQFMAEARKPVTERELTGFDISTNKINMVHRWWPAINGKGMDISIKENLMDTTDLDFTGRYLSSPSAAITMQTHATTMATMAAGGGNTYYTGKGIAWGANISSADFSNLLPDKITDLQQLKVAVQNHSYGTGIENYYGADAAAYDAQLFQNPALLHVFSAGNAGTQTPASGNYAGISGFANLTGSFKMSKNSLSVGAIDSFKNITGISSRGPAFDGRVKPELVALGEDGSSGAAAIVSGLAVLVKDYWQQKNSNQTAASSLVKAILINSADDVGAPGIDYVSGYGAANGWRAFQTIAENRIFLGSFSQAQTVLHTISLPANARNLKLTLCWTDPPAQANSFRALINDLDLELVHTGTNQQWLPWVLNSKAQKDSLQLLPVRKRDSLNNTEQITVDLPPAGNYRINVKGYALNSTQQPYSIAWQYDTTDYFQFTYPVKGDNLFPAQTHTIRWETTLNGNGNLQYRLPPGNWQTINASVDLSKQYYQWQVPDQTAAVQLRLLYNTKEWQTDTVSLSPRLLINTGFNCLDSFLVYWQKAAVDSYRVYRLGQQYLEPLAIMRDTALIQLKKNNPYQYFTVAPIVPFSIEGAKAYAFNYTRQQVDCYISSFIADPSGTTNARLNLQLGTVYQVARVVFEKLGSNGFSAIRTISPVLNKQVITTETAGNGLNTYRARVELINGQVYYTNPEQVIQFGAQSYYIFPNPAQPGSAIRILSNDIDDIVFRLFDANGNKVAEQKITSYNNPLTLPVLARGVYFGVLYKAGVKQLSQQLVIQ